MANTFAVNKPEAADLLSQSQGDLQGDFLYIQGALGKDHQVVQGDTDATTFEGRHLQVSLKDRGMAVAHPGDGTSSFFYDNGGQTFWRNSTVGPVQMTNQTVPLLALAGYSSLPGGLLIQWKQVAIANGSQVLTFPTPFKVAGFGPIVTCTDHSNLLVFLSITAQTNTGFTLTAIQDGGGGFAGTVNFVAIGESP